jgi:GntR family histidine utilization transcriptional repressor
VGTFVSDPKPQSPLFEIKPIDQEIRDTGGNYTCDVLHLQAEKASPDLAAGMDLNPYDPVYHSIIVHKRNGEPFQLADRYVHPSIAPGYIKQDFTAITPSAYLTKRCPATLVEHVIESLIPDVWVRNGLAINAAEPCLVLHRKTWVDDCVATVSTFYYPGSRHRIGGRFKPVNGGEFTIM